jgi:hypothetical protein
MQDAAIMGGLRTTLAVLLMAALPAWAGGLPLSPAQRLEAFATCAGRLSAMVEHQWLVAPDASEATEAQRDGFGDLVDAVLPDALAWGVPREMAMHWRVAAKAAQRELLTLATFGTDPDRAARARGLADARLAECDGLLIG